jgi:hypothetical protein
LLTGVIESLRYLRHLYLHRSFSSINFFVIWKVACGRVTKTNIKGAAQYRSKNERTIKSMYQGRFWLVRRIPQERLMNLNMKTGVTNTLKIMIHGIPSVKRKIKLQNQKKPEPL